MRKYSIFRVLSRNKIIRSIIYRAGGLIKCNVIVETEMSLSREKILVPLNDFIGYQLFAFGGFESHIQKAARGLGLEGKTILDVGANIGAFTFNICDLPNKIYAIEANPECCKLLTASVDYSKKSNVEVINRAVTSVSNEQVNLRVSSNTLGNSSICYKGDPSNSTVVVNSISIDDFVFKNNIRPDLIKVDIEGAEPLFLQGARKTIREFRPIIIMEFNGSIISTLSQSLDDYQELFDGHYDYFIILESGKLEQIDLNYLHGAILRKRSLDICFIAVSS